MVDRPGLPAQRCRRTIRVLLVSLAFGDFLRGTTMATISSIGSSGLQAAQLRLDASANNVANMNTPNYRRQVVAQEEAADSAGVRATVQRQQEAEGVALEKEAVEQMSATYAFKANLQTIKTQDEMMGSLLDVKA